MRVAAVQFEPLLGDLSRNRAALTLLTRTAARAEPELIVLPEMCTSGYVFPDKESIAVYCEPRNGPSVSLFQREAQRLQTTICFGWPEVNESCGSLFNSAAICFPDGSTIFYRKNLLYEADECWAEPGDNPYPEWTSRDGHRCTLGICMDLNDDKFVDFLTERQIRVVAFPTNWIDQDFKVWNYWAYRLQNTRACLVAANRYGTEGGTKFCGDSAVLDGRVLLGMTEDKTDTVVWADIPIDPVPYISQDED